MDTFDFKLPALDGSEAPAFDTALAAKEWVAALPLANPAMVQSELLAEMEKLNRWPLPARERLAILEALRKALSFAQDEAGKRYGGKALPLAYGEQRTLFTTLELRRACLTGTVHCFDEALGDSDPAFAALVLQRAMTHLASLHLEHLRGGQALAATDWKQLHGLLALAESRDLSQIPVADPVRHGDAASSIGAVYAEALLLHAASPFEMTPRQLAWTARWARRWGSKLVLSKTPPDKLDALPLAVDLASSLPPRHLPFSGPGAHFLLTQGLRESIKSRVALLGQGRLPAELQLGDDCTQPACEQLLKQLYPRWCKGGQPRGTERRPEDCPGRVLTDSDSIYFHLSGGRHLQQAAAAPSQTSIADLRREREQMAMFGTLHRAESKSLAAAAPPPVEDCWQLKDESATGLRLARPLAAANAARLKLGQLIAVEPPGSRHFFLASLRWLMAAPAEGEGWLLAGAQLMPGPAEAVTLKTEDAPQDSWHPAYFLPGLAVRKEAASVVLPAATFRLGRVLQLRDGSQIKLTRLVERGDNYERALYDNL